MTDFDAIVALIALTNNGKLLIARLPRDLRDAAPALIAAGKLRSATFMYAGDAIRLP